MNIFIHCSCFTYHHTIVLSKNYEWLIRLKYELVFIYTYLRHLVVDRNFRYDRSGIHQKNTSFLNCYANRKWANHTDSGEDCVEAWVICFEGGRHKHRWGKWCWLCRYRCKNPEKKIMNLKYLSALNRSAKRSGRLYLKLFSSLLVSNFNTYLRW